MLDIITKTLALVAAAAILVVILIGFLFPDPAYSCAGSPLMYDQPQVRTGATQRIKPNAYGLGVHMDQFGRPVRTVPAW